MAGYTFDSQDVRNVSERAYKPSQGKLDTIKDQEPLWWCLRCGTILNKNEQKCSNCGMCFT